MFVAALIAAGLYAVTLSTVGGVVGAYVVRERRRGRLDPAIQRRRPEAETTGEWEEYEGSVSPRDRDGLNRR